MSLDKDSEVLLREFVRNKLLSEIGIGDLFSSMTGNKVTTADQHRKQTLVAAKTMINNLLTTANQTSKNVKPDPNAPDQAYEKQRVKDELVQNVIFAVLTSLINTAPAQLGATPMKGITLQTLKNAQKIAAQNLLLTKQKDPVTDYQPSVGSGVVNAQNLYKTTNIEAQRRKLNKVKKEKELDKLSQEDLYKNIESLRGEEYDINSTPPEKLAFLNASLDWLKANGKGTGTTP